MTAGFTLDGPRVVPTRQVVNRRATNDEGELDGRGSCCECIEPPRLRRGQAQICKFGYLVVTRETPVNADPMKQLRVACPEGKKATGAGWGVLDPTKAILEGEVTFFEPEFDGRAWIANAKNNSAFQPNWMPQLRSSAWTSRSPDSQDAPRRHPRGEQRCGRSDSRGWRLVETELRDTKARGQGRREAAEDLGCRAAYRTVGYCRARWCTCSRPVGQSFGGSMPGNRLVHVGPSGGLLVASLATIATTRPPLGVGVAIRAA